MDFPQYMGVDFDLTVEKLIGTVQNVTKAGVVVDDFAYYLTSAEDFTPSPSFWIYKGRGTCSIYSTTVDIKDVPYFEIFEGRMPKYRNCTVKRIFNGSTAYIGGRVDRYPTEAKEDYRVGVVGDSDIWIYPMACEIKLPMFTDVNDGVAYTTAAGNYYYNPTPENYETLCHYIDLCDNPDG